MYTPILIAFVSS